MRIGIVLALLVAPAAAQGPPQVQVNAPYVTTPDRVVRALLELAGVRKGDIVYDLGCGDGRIVIAAAKLFGARGVGIEINPDHVRDARGNARKAGVEGLVKFQVGDLFEADISEATVVALYLLPDFNLRLRPKLLRDLKPGVRVVSHAFEMGDWAPAKKATVEDSPIYLWTIPAR